MMAITTGLAFLYMRSQGWSLALAVPTFAVFALIDLTFLGANLLKIAEGGWFPIVVAALVFAVMVAWAPAARRETHPRRDAAPGIRGGAESG
jgi:KUP system potassium uptake protein